MISNTIRCYLGGEIQLVHLNASSLKLFSLVAYTTYLLLLRLLSALICVVSKTPRCFMVHIDTTEIRIVGLVVSILRMLPGKTQQTPLSAANRRGRLSGNGDYIVPVEGLADNMIMPRESSLDFDRPSESSFRRLNASSIAYRPQAPRPPYRRGFENMRPSLIRTTQLRTDTQQSFAIPFSLDGTVSPPLFDPIPRVPNPPMPVFIARHISVSDSIYSSRSVGLPGRRYRSTSTSFGGEKSPANVESYTSVLPNPAFADSDSPYLSSETKKVQSDNDIQKANFSNASTFPGHFPISEDLEYGSLTTVAQHYFSSRNERPKIIRPLSAPVVRTS
ncbi:hypothetical protein BGW36DRAFT_372119 [Talaromyces proteolyticus]|uniref:Uncharacterized protein n=1 Tax=Talaromyces proteolyticus TaxID=1131652 RepID=A0AAD4KVM6_9EURO|nr:uncharacterized protein BGW36DRAFT_372119 [Talaromyces proteolyticus]KAH8702057.1 hypothetical protein BGW36DRAFT_372119 [Talaromyces proteolyticus]